MKHHIYSMINENITFVLFRYTSNKLSRGSDKKVLRICSYCKEERLVKYRQCTDLCHTCKCKTKEYRKKQSENNSGKNHPMYGKPASDKTKLKMSKTKQGMCDGDKNPNWKGGKKLTNARRNAKRRKLFGFIPHNKHQENFHGHHLDFNHVIFIPMELHQSIRHSVTRNINMDLINDIVCNWFLNDQLPSSIC